MAEGEGLVTKKDILFPGTDLSELGSVDFDSPEVKKVIEETNRRQIEILSRDGGRYPMGR